MKLNWNDEDIREILYVVKMSLLAIVVILVFGTIVTLVKQLG